MIQLELDSRSWLSYFTVIPEKVIHDVDPSKIFYTVPTLLRTPYCPSSTQSQICIVAPLGGKKTRLG